MKKVRTEIIWYALSVKIYNGVKIWVSKKNMM